MEIKIKVDILTELSLVSLMWHKKKPVDGVSKLLSISDHTQTVPGQKIYLCFALSILWI